ncbi:PspC domain-containing protein [Chloroflexota bacterium]
MSERVKKLYRSTVDRKLAGVCGGIGEYFELDPTIIRVLFVLFSVFLGGGILAYIILWLVMPPEPETTASTEEETE